MTVSVGTGLARVTVSTPKRRIDVALPEDLAVAELLPSLLLHAGEGAADDGERHGGWALRTSTGTLLAGDRNLSGQGVRDGDVLHLVPRRADWPELEYDDVVEAIASGARRYGRSWGGTATRRCALAVGTGALLLGVVGILSAGPPWALPGWLSLGVALLLCVVGTVLARAAGDAVAGAAVAGPGLVYAAAGGAVAVAPAGTDLGELGAAHLLVGSVALATAGIVGYLGVGAHGRVFVGGVATGLLGVVGGLLALMTGMSEAGIAAIVLTLAISLLPAYPLLSMRIGKLPMPVLPQRTEEMLRDDPVPQRAEVFAAVARADEVLTGLLLAVSVTGVACGWVLAGTERTSAVILVAVASAALLLRGRLFPTPRQRIPLLAGGVLGLALLFTGFALAMPVLVAVPVALVVGGTVLGAGLLYSRRPPSPYVGRLADILDVLLLVSLLPIACLLTGFYGYVQGLFASLGG
ncbi:type VII secretion integral membrane protein EccD [Cryptosporangium aurantiacum]|uniref:Type VII secretion integral membrane protein EccD n=1 Tax=Cryptosporangium aurantiacum TaxID=134849 RepID=A0A1M7TXJ9_9ACTN|nr:type VII secretion integral membrane protein EccD [Cryptosporangium aurantiacum]SHN75448.1 type VII secretion integral membrane protein EccD [Cryptosporangium aurantiacum]